LTAEAKYVATLGMVGGLGPESTIDYYRRILEEWKRDNPGSSPSIIIDSLDVDRGLRLVEHDRPALVEYLLASLRRLAAAGADVAAMAANHDFYVGQLLKGEFRDETRDGVKSVIRRLREEGNIDGVILGGTELTLLLSEQIVADIPALDTTALHVDAIVNRLRA
jgi:aspartate racemase